MLQDELNNYPIDRVTKIILYIIYDNNDFIGYQKNIIFSDNYYRKKMYDKNERILSDIKYAPNDTIVSGDIYQNGTFIQHIETTTDSSGNRHEILLDSSNKTISHKKFDRHNRFIGGNVYENGVFRGCKKIRYIENDKKEIIEVHETVFDANYNFLSDIKINPKTYITTEKKLTEIILETHIISHTKNGKTYETIFDGKNNIISKPKLVKEPETNTFVQTPKINNNVSNISTQPNQTKNTDNKIIVFLYKLLGYFKQK